MEFDEYASLCYETPAQIATYLRAIDDPDAARRFEEAGITGQGLSPFRTKYDITGKRFGHIAPEQPTVISAITSIAPNEAPIGTAVKVTLDKFYVEEFPGTGPYDHAPGLRPEPGRS